MSQAAAGFSHAEPPPLTTHTTITTRPRSKRSLPGLWFASATIILLMI
jgi:hypothetical protein